MTTYSPETLESQLQNLLLRSQSVQMALGQFAPAELGTLAGQMRHVKRLQLLLGSNAERQDACAVLERQGRVDTAAPLLEAERFADRAQTRGRVASLRQSIRRMLGRMRQSESDAQAIHALADLVGRGGVEVRASVGARLTADMVLGEGSAASDALVSAGMLLAPSLTPDAFHLKCPLTPHLSDTFEQWWQEGVPFRDPLREELQNCWAAQPTTPYLLYLFVLYRLVADRLTDEETDNDEWMQGMPPLTDFQQVAVRQAASVLNQYGGVFVGDVVGLGKTYIGTALLKRLAVQGLRATIFCPPALAPMWQEMNDVYGLSAMVYSTGRLARYGEELKQAEFQTQDRQIVLVDESHRFRNPYSESYRTLSDYTQSRRCILLTATPYSLQARDVLHQMRLFAPDDLDLGLTPPRLDDYFRAIEAGKASLVDVLRPLLIRRTRRHIQKHYPDAELQTTSADGTITRRRLHFPTRNKPHVVRYDIESAYGEAGLYDYIVAKLGGPGDGQPLTLPELSFDLTRLTYARYRLAQYVLPTHQATMPYKDLRQAGAGVRGFIRILLFKRLESSTYAFKRTIDTLLQAHDNFLAALRQGYVLAGDAAHKLLYESWETEEDLADALARASTRYELAAFDVPALKRDIENDAEVFAELKALLASLTAANDSKLLALRDLLRGDLAGRKVLIFTQFEATAQYVSKHLEDLPNVAYLSGQHRGAGRSFMQTVARFAPRANPRFAQPDAPPLDCLVATDVLSEGLNLQDCSIVFNYDLHYNPVRLIQRVGRVDRVGSEAETIDLYNFFPEKNVEKVLRLEEVLRKRIGEIHAFIGEDNAILHPDERINEQEMYASYTAVPEAEESRARGVDYTEIEEQMRLIQRENPDLLRQVRDLPFGVRSARRGQTSKGTVVFFTDDNGFDRLQIVGRLGNVTERATENILDAMICDETEAAMTLPDTHNKTVSKAFDVFEQAAAERQADRDAKSRMSAAQRYAVRALTSARKQESDEDRKNYLLQLEQAFQSPLPEAAYRELNRLRRLTLPDEAVVARLEYLHQQLDLGRYIRGRQGELHTGGARILCTEALV